MNKGFTLVELLGVIAVLILIFMLAVPAVNKVVNNSENTIYDIQINKILNSAYDYSLKNLSILPNKYQKNYITLSDLIYSGIIDPVENPITNELFPDDYLISIENVGTKYRNRDKYAKKNGNYLYKIEVEEMEDDDYIANKPQIYLEDLDRNNNSYTTRINQEGVFEEQEPIIYDKNGDEIEDARVTKNILFEGDVVPSVDTSKIGIYKINFVAIYESNNRTYANALTWNVIIVDTEAPTITLPNNSTIATSVNTFDLMNGVKCIDNSGKCDITYSGTINYGTRGTYVITYTAVDDAGNISSSRRIITVE